MKIETSLIKTIKLTEVEKLDPITLIVDDVNGKLTIEVYGKAWSAYWHSAKGSVSKFFLSCENDYIIRCLDREIKATECDFDAIPNFLKKIIVDGRRDCNFSKKEAREMFDSLEYESFERIDQIHSIELKYLDDDWLYYLPERVTYEWSYLDRIVTAIKEAFNQENNNNSLIADK